MGSGRKVGHIDTPPSLSNSLPGSGEVSITPGQMVTKGAAVKIATIITRANNDC